VKRWVLIVSFAVMAGFWGGAPFVVGCNSPSRAAYNTLSATGKAVDMAEREYMDKIVRGELRTNDFPRIQSGYRAFQTSYLVALNVASGNTNALTPPALSQQASKLIGEIRGALKKGKL
jgi:hypothetical protein